MVVLLSAFRLSGQSRVISFSIQKWLQPLFNMRKQLSFLMIFAALLTAGAAARADVWGYVDNQGVAHFSVEKLDERYQLFFRGGEAFDTSGGVPVRSSVAGYGVPGLPAASPRLLAFFDVSPNYKAVKHLLRDASVAQDIDYELLQALIATESGFNTHAVSPKGAVGLMQLMPPTAQRYGVRSDKNSAIEKKLTDPKTNIGAGSRYLRDLINMFPGQLELALAAYNAGEGAVQRAGNKIPNYPETKNYVKTVMQLYVHLKPPSPIVDSRRAAGRVRMEMMGGALKSPSQPAGGASGRGNNLPTLVVQSPVAPEFRIERD